MIFCEYYSTYINTNGVPILSIEQHKRLFNIVYLEGRLIQIKKDLELFGDNTITRTHYGDTISKLKKLYIDTHPASVLSDMIYKSK